MKRSTLTLGFTLVTVIACGGSGEGTAEPLTVGGAPTPVIGAGNPVGIPGSKPGGGNGGTGNTGNTGGVGNTGGGGNCLSDCAAYATECQIPDSLCAPYCAQNPDPSCTAELGCQDDPNKCLGGGGSGGGNTGGTAGAGATGGNPNTGGTTSGCSPTDNCAGCPDPQSGSEQCFTTCTCYVAAGLATEDCNAACFGA